VQESNQQ